MKILSLIFATVISMAAFANTKAFEVQIKEISINGNLMPNNRTIKFKPNQTQVISRSVDESGANTIIELSVSDSAPSGDGILAKFTVTKEDHGSRKVLGTPRIVAQPGREAQIAEGQEGEQPFIKVAIIAKRTQ